MSQIVELLGAASNHTTGTDFYEKRTKSYYDPIHGYIELDDI